MTLSYGALILAAAALPCIAFLWALDRFDRYQKEPRGLRKVLQSGNHRSWVKATRDLGAIGPGQSYQTES